MRRIDFSALAVFLYSICCFAGVSGIGVANYTYAGAKSLRVFKIVDTHVDSAYDIAAGSDYWSGTAMNTHGTHTAYWRRTREFVDSTFSTADWQDIIAQQDDAVLYLLATYRTPAEAASITGCSQARAEELKAVADSIALKGSGELWGIHHLRSKQPDAWNFEISYDNTSGMWTKTVRKVAPEFRLTLMRIDNPSKTLDIVITGNDLADFPRYEGPGSIAWPKGDWIYFSTFGRGLRFFYRVNTQTREVQFVTLLDETWRMIYPGIPCCCSAIEFKISTLGNYLLVSNTGLFCPLDELQARKGVPDFNNWDGGGMFALGGCGFSISPTGQWAGNQYDAGHWAYVINNLDWKNKKVISSAIYPADIRNEWSVDKDDPKLACTLSSGMVESIGSGNETLGHNYAVNSDRWVCNRTGWAPGGRFGSNGLNFILTNFIDSVALNVSRGVRTPDQQFGTVESQCYTEQNGVWANDPMFFVQSPVDDIVPELQDDAQTNYIVPGLDDNSQIEQVSMMPMTPYNGLESITRIRNGVSENIGEIAGEPSVRINIICSRSSLVVHMAGLNGPCEIAIFDCHGALVTQRKSTRTQEIFARNDGIRPGAYVVKISARNSKTAALKGLLLK